MMKGQTPAGSYHDEAQRLGRATAVRAHVPASAPRIGAPDLLLRDSQGRVAEHQGTGFHTPEAHDAVTVEQVACTLGHRVRPELMVDTVGEFARAVRAIGQELRRAVLASLAPLRRTFVLLAEAEAEHQRELHERAARRD